MIRIFQGDITKESVDAIVNAANTQLKGGGGVDGAIHRAAGPSVMKECRKIGKCPTGEAVITGAGDLKARFIIHTAGPVWNGGSRGEAELLEHCYRRSFSVAREAGLKSIAFPAISTGVYGYPKREAARIALQSGRREAGNFERIHYVCFSVDDKAIYDEVWQELQNETRF